MLLKGPIKLIVNLRILILYKDFNPHIVGQKIKLIAKIDKIIHLSWFT